MAIDNAHDRFVHPVPTASEEAPDSGTECTSRGKVTPRPTSGVRWDEVVVVALLGTIQLAMLVAAIVAMVLAPLG